MKKLTEFLYETGQLKRVKRSGWWTINIKNPESVAEHSYRAAVIGYFLAQLEKVNVHKVMLMCLFNDIHESRLNDLHKVGHRYIDFKEAENKAHAEQCAGLGNAGDELLSLLTDFQQRESPEAQVARDADLLENALQAREYIKIGYADAQDWLDNINKIIHTESGKKLLKEIETIDPNSWWKGLKKIER
jgi:putative hydrolases of HD superfamily